LSGDGTDIDDPAEGIGLELASIELTKVGYIKVNERLQTTAPGVGPLVKSRGVDSSHISGDDFRVVHDNINGVHHRPLAETFHTACSQIPSWPT
jgi:pyruvate/2-oxoglutarate dehydrogenase complex dihydrolipoamide dehydrogenase (E3) component